MSKMFAKYADDFQEMDKGPGILHHCHTMTQTEELLEDCRFQEGFSRIARVDERFEGPQGGYPNVRIRINYTSWLSGR